MGLKSSLPATDLAKITENDHQPLFTSSRRNVQLTDSSGAHHLLLLGLVVTGLIDHRTDNRVVVEFVQEGFGLRVVSDLSELESKSSRSVLQMYSDM